MDALRRAPLPPDAVQLPTSFELLGGGGGPGGIASPRLSPRLAEGGLAAAAGGTAAGGGGMVEAGALPVQPGELQRSPSLDDLLSKVQRIDASQVSVLAKIGEGAFGEVSLAHCSTYGNVAVKWIKPTKVERHWASFWHEAELMSRLNHPNVLRFFGLVVEGPMVVGIMTEFAAAGSLAQYLRSGVGFIPLRQRAQLALHAVNGMAYLHSLKVVHFDVKPDNLLVDGDWLSERGPVVKVADFGLSKHKYNTFCSNVHDLRGTLPYMAPEMIMDHQHVTEKADVWSLGVVFWEMLTLEVPFADMPPAQLIGALGLGKLRLTIPEWCEPDWRALMESCWVEDPALRPSCRQLATHLERIRDMAR
jgi:serine/threonine protein kinase